MRVMGRWGLVALLLAALAGCDGGGDGGGNGGSDGAGAADGGPDAVADSGGPGLDAVAPAGVVVNEVGPAAVGPDWVELYNGAAAAADVSGWELRDNDDTHTWTLPDGSSVPAGGFLVLYESDGTGGEGFEFGLGAEDAVRLFDPAGALADDTAWLAIAAPAGRSWGRWPDGSGAFATLPTPTPGAPNARPGEEPTDVVSPDAGGEDATPVEPPPIVVNELVALDPLGGPDWVELYNLGDEDVAVGGFLVADDPEDPLEVWEALPAGRVVPAHGFLVLTSGADFTFAFNSDESFAIALPDDTLIDETTWLDGQAPGGGSWGRYPDGTGDFATLPAPTPGAANAAPAL